MPKFKPTNPAQGLFLPVYLDRQLQPGTFEDTLCKLIDDVLDLSAFDQRYSNERTGSPAYDPGALLKVIFLAYSRGITSSRRISEECRENTVHMAMSGNSKPYHPTTAGFVSSMHLEVKNLFLQILLLCESERADWPGNVCHRPMQAAKQRLERMKRNTISQGKRSGIYSILAEGY